MIHRFFCTLFSFKYCVPFIFAVISPFCVVGISTVKQGSFLNQFLLSTLHCMNSFLMKRNKFFFIISYAMHYFVHYDDYDGSYIYLPSKTLELLCFPVLLGSIKDYQI